MTLASGSGVNGVLVAAYFLLRCCANRPRERRPPRRLPGAANHIIPPGTSAQSSTAMATSSPAAGWLTAWTARRRSMLTRV